MHKEDMRHFSTSLDDGVDAKHIRLHVWDRVLDTASDVRLRSKIYDSLDAFLPKDSVDQWSVCDVPVDEGDAISYRIKESNVASVC
jgi:hypothetical protein